MARVVAAAGQAGMAVTAPPPAQPLVAGALAARRGGAGVPVLVVTAGERDADATADLLRCFLPDRRGGALPPPGGRPPRGAHPPAGPPRPRLPPPARPPPPRAHRSRGGPRPPARRRPPPPPP